MSIKVMTLVWDGFPGAGSEMLVMLALADHCNDHGGSLFPSIKSIAKKVRLSEDQARRVMHKLERDGYVAVIGNHKGGAPGTTRQYQLNVELLKLQAQRACASARGESETGCTGAVRRVAPMQETGGTDASQTVNETSEETSLPAISPFDQFWTAYPRKEGKVKAESAWKTQKPNLNIVLSALEAYKKTRQWQKESGQFIPLPANWISQRRWEDELPEPYDDRAWMFEGTI